MVFGIEMNERRKCAVRHNGPLPIDWTAKANLGRDAMAEYIITWINDFQDAAWAEYGSAQMHWIEDAEMGCNTLKTVDWTTLGRSRESGTGSDASNFSIDSSTRIDGMLMECQYEYFEPSPDINCSLWGMAT